MNQRYWLWQNVTATRRISGQAPALGMKKEVTPTVVGPMKELVQLVKKTQILWKIQVKSKDTKIIIKQKI